VTSLTGRLRGYRLHTRPLAALLPPADFLGQRAEAFARVFGTPKFIASQTVVILVWLTLNAVVVALRWDPYPFILLNLVFSTQAAYAAPLILLAQNRATEREKIKAQLMFEHGTRAEVLLKLICLKQGIDPAEAETVVQDALAHEHSARLDSSPDPRSAQNSKQL
jgi:uncharacterized membrane protein